MHVCSHPIHWELSWSPIANKYMFKYNISLYYLLDIHLKQKSTFCTRFVSHNPHQSMLSNPEKLSLFCSIKEKVSCSGSSALLLCPKMRMIGLAQAWLADFKKWLYSSRWNVWAMPRNSLSGIDIYALCLSCPSYFFWLSVTCNAGNKVTLCSFPTTTFCCHLCVLKCIIDTTDFKNLFLERHFRKCRSLLFLLYRVTLPFYES